MLFRMEDSVNSTLQRELMRALAILILVPALTSGCIRVPRAVTTVPPGEWLVRQGDTRHTAFAAEHVPESVRIVWDEGMGRGLPATPIVHDDLIIAVISGGGIITASATTGERYWSRRFNGAIAGQALRVADRIFIATQHRKGNVFALDVRRGRRLWGRDLDARATAEPAYADGVLFQPTDRGDVVALDAARGSVLWRTSIGGQTTLPPLVAGPNLLIAVRDTIVLMERAHGAVLRRVAIGSAPTAPLALSGDTIVVVGGNGTVSARAEHGARLLWRHDVGGVVLAAPIIAPEGVYVLTRQAALLRVTAGGVETLAQLEGAATESLTLTASGLLVGLLDGRLLLVRRSGAVVWEQRVTGSLRAPSAVRDSSVYVATLGGRLVKLSP